MAIQIIKAEKENKATGVKKEAAINYDFGDSLSESIEKYGENVVFSNFKKSAVITAQSVMRRYLDANKSQDEIVSAMASWKPGVSLERVSDPEGAFMAKWEKMTPEERFSMLEKLKA